MERITNERGWLSASPREVQLLRYCNVPVERDQFHTRHLFAPAWAAAILDHEDTHEGQLDLLSYAMELDEDFRDALDAQAVADPAGVVDMIDSYGTTVDPEGYAALNPGEGNGDA